MKIRVSTQMDGDLYCFYQEEAEKPRISPGEILVRIEASSLNYHDLAVVDGRRKIPEGLVPLNDGAGIVEEVGEGVTEFETGDRVMSRFFPRWIAGKPSHDRLFEVPGDQVDGFAVRYVTRAATAFTRIPQGYSLLEAATLPCAAMTAWRALFVEGRIRPGSVVVTQGAGGMSVFALQFAKVAGATVIATSSSEAKMARLRELGADHVLNYRENPAWGRQVLKLTEGRGADLVVEVGGGDTLLQSAIAARIGGQIALIGALDGAMSENPTRLLLSRNITLSGLSVANRDDQMEMVRAIEATGLKPVIDRVFALGELRDAFLYQKAGRHFGKICVDYGLR